MHLFLLMDLFLPPWHFLMRHGQWTRTNVGLETSLKTFWGELLFLALNSSRPLGKKLQLSVPVKGLISGTHIRVKWVNKQRSHHLLSWQWNTHPAPTHNKAKLYILPDDFYGGRKRKSEREKKKKREGEMEGETYSVLVLTPLGVWAHWMGNRENI